MQFNLNNFLTLNVQLIFFFENFCLFPHIKNKQTTKKEKTPTQSKKDLVLAHGMFDAINQCKSVRGENSESISFILI